MPPTLLLLRRAADAGAFVITDDSWTKKITGQLAEWKDYVSVRAGTRACKISISLYQGSRA